MPRMEELRGKGPSSGDQREKEESVANIHTRLKTGQAPDEGVQRSNTSEEKGKTDRKKRKK